MTITFQATIDPDGKITIPKPLLEKLRSSVVSVTLTEETVAEKKADAKENIIDKWLRDPLKVPGFKPMSRDEIYDGR